MVKIVLTILSLLNGAYMLADGIYVMLKGKYIGPPVPGPWAILFRKLQIDVFKLGPLFVVFGLAWLVFIYSLWTKQSWAYPFGMVVSLLTLWYLPIGTLLSVIVIVLLLTMRTKLGI